MDSVKMFLDIQNGKSRCVRAALERFSQICFNIRSGKCRPFILNLLPCFVRLAYRDEEVIQECLATSFQVYIVQISSYRGSV